MELLNKGKVSKIGKIPPIPSEYKYDAESVIRSLNGQRQKVAEDWRQVFKEMDDDTAEMALQEAEKGVKIDSAVAEAQAGKEAIQRSLERSKRLWEPVAREDIAAQGKAAMERNAAEVEKGLERRTKLWEQEAGIRDKLIAAEKAKEIGKNLSSSQEGSFPRVRGYVVTD